jgi:uncharacterized protein with PQ loop repeat
MFRILGVGVLIYVVYAIALGRVYIKAGWRGRTVLRADSPESFWVYVAIYGALGVALMTVF